MSIEINQNIWNNWINKVEWILEIAKNKNWDVSKLEIKDRVSMKAFDHIEKDLKIAYPPDFKKVLTEYSSGLLMSWQIEGEEPTDIYSEIFCGGGRGYLWDFYTLRDDFKNCQSWKKECFSNPDDEYDNVWYNKIPFLNVPNGDMIAFGEETDKGFPVVYLSHEDGALHGCKLGDNFVDFITKWTNIGCVGTEDWQLEPFYDYDNSMIKETGEEVDNWKKWLNN